MIKHRYTQQFFLDPDNRPEEYLRAFVEIFQVFLNQDMNPNTLTHQSYQFIRLNNDGVWNTKNMVK